MASVSSSQRLHRSSCNFGLHQPNLLMSIHTVLLVFGRYERLLFYHLKSPNLITHSSGLTGTCSNRKRNGNRTHRARTPGYAEREEAKVGGSPVWRSALPRESGLAVEESGGREE